MTRIAFAAAIAAALFSASAPAVAAVLTFTVSGADTASFSLDTSTYVPAYFHKPDLNYDHFENVAAVVNGTSYTASVDLYDAISGGGLQISIPQHIYLSLSGDSVIEGSVADPVFKTGTFNLTYNYVTDASTSDTLVVSNGSRPAVPEPATWAMMLCGFGAIGVALRRRKLQVSFG